MKSSRKQASATQQSYLSVCSDKIEHQMWKFNFISSAILISWFDEVFISQLNWHEIDLPSPRDQVEHLDDYNRLSMCFLDYGLVSNGEGQEVHGAVHFAAFSCIILPGFIFMKYRSRDMIIKRESMLIFNSVVHCL